MDPAIMDFFGLDKRKKKEITVEMLDYDYIGKCKDIDVMKGILERLRSGVDGKYPQLEKTAEDKLLELLPANERAKILAIRMEPSREEVSSERDDLSGWAQKMSQLDECLKSTAKANAPRSVPPVRYQKDDFPTKSSDNKAITNKSAKVNITSTQADSPSVDKTKRISGYDFNAWEKYDVDKALNEIDEEEEKRKASIAQKVEQSLAEKKQRKEMQSIPSGIDVDALTEAEKQVYALREKHKGNECFKAGEMEEAILYYSRSIAFDDTNAVVYANRGLACLREKKFQQAEDDCSKAIELDTKYAKAWTRRGMTRHRRGKYSEAISDFEQALALEGSNAEIKRLLKESQDKWKEVEGERAEKVQDSEQEQPVPRFEEITDTEDANHCSPIPKGVQPLPSVSNNGVTKATSVRNPQSGFTRIQVVEEDDSDDDQDELVHPSPGTRKIEVIDS